MTSTGLHTTDYRRYQTGKFMNDMASASQRVAALLVAVLSIALLATASADPGFSAEEVARERAALLAIMAQSNAPSADAAARIPYPDAETLGAVDASVLILEFGDYQCGFCRRHVANVMPALEQGHLATGRVRYVFMEYPAERNLPTSFEASNAALCAGDQGHYWEMRQRLYANPMSLDADGYRWHAQSIGLDLPAFADCLEQAPHADRIREHVALGQQLGVRGTPTFFLAVPVEETGDLQLVRRITGAQPIDLFERELQALAME